MEIEIAILVVQQATADAVAGDSTHHCDRMNEKQNLKGATEKLGFRKVPNEMERTKEMVAKTWDRGRSGAGEVEKVRKATGHASGIR
jgi:hypothetical protein